MDLAENGLRIFWTGILQTESRNIYISFSPTAWRRSRETTLQTAGNFALIREQQRKRDACITAVVSASTTCLHGDNLESLLGGQGVDVRTRVEPYDGKLCLETYQFLVVDFVLSALSVLALHPQLGDGVQLHCSH